jgi:hypothetical protein
MIANLASSYVKSWTPNARDVIMLVIFPILLALIWFLYKEIDKKDKVIDEKNQEIDEKNKEIDKNIKEIGKNNEMIKIEHLMGDFNRLMSFSQSTSSALNITLARKEIIMQHSGEVFSAMMGPVDWANSLPATAANKKLFRKHIDKLASIPVDNSRESIVQTWMEGLINACEKKARCVGKVVNIVVKYQCKTSSIEGFELKYAKKPDGVFLRPNIQIGRLFFGDLLMVLEMKPTDRQAISHGLIQSFGYGLEQLKFELELHRSFTRRYVVYTMASGGKLLLVGRIELADYQITLYGPTLESPTHGLPLTYHDGDANTIPLGIQALHALCNKNHPKDGGAIVDGYQLQEILGLGSFCTVAVATVLTDRKKTKVVVKLPRFLSTNQDAMACLQTEFTVLTKMNQVSTATSCPNIPRLHNAVLRNCIAFRDRGVQIVDFLVELTLGERSEFIDNCIPQLLAGVSFAHSQGICHRDLRVDNIVALRGPTCTRVVVQIIDWGLASATGEFFHNHTGGILYFHNDLVEKGDEITTIVTLEKYDLASILYIEMAMRDQLGVAGLHGWGPCGDSMEMLSRRMKFVDNNIDSYQFSKLLPNIARDVVK